METLRPYDNDIPLVRGGYLEGPYVFGFLIHAFPLRDMVPNIKGNYMGLKIAFFRV